MSDLVKSTDTFHSQYKKLLYLDTHARTFPWATGREGSPCLIFSLPVKFAEGARIDDTQVSSPAERISSNSSGLPSTSTHHSTQQSTVTPRGTTPLLQHGPKTPRGERGWAERHQGERGCGGDGRTEKWGLQGDGRTK